MQSRDEERNVLQHISEQCEETGKAGEKAIQAFQDAISWLKGVIRALPKDPENPTRALVTDEKKLVEDARRFSEARLLPPLQEFMIEIKILEKITNPQVALDLEIYRKTGDEDRGARAVRLESMIINYTESYQNLKD